ncbi:MAG: alpha-hydroxy-acid oxidizing protein [Planctomycetales bacterium]|nr:alpha-hydroxy-acid oxidizing protein [Planctomycetales bacterium]
MDRRTFAQHLALGFGSLGLLPPTTLQSTCAADDVPQPGVPGDQAAGEPVKVADFQSLAAAKLPKATYDYITTGSADEITLRENVAAFQRIRILPPLLTGVASADPATTVLKQPIRLPIMLAPVAAQQMYHRDGALAAARAAVAAVTVYGVSSSVGHSVEEVAGASEGLKWFQLYVPKDRAVARRLVERVERAGYQAIIVTVDMGEWKDADRRNRFSLPKEVLLKHLRDVGFTQIKNDMTYQEVVDFNTQAWDLALSWDVFAWLRSITKLPLLIKGVLRKEDAAKAVSLGLDGIIVSNHGGRRLDGMPASIEMLPEVVQAVGGRAEVFIDGGIRRGTDVLIALALGAKAVLIGRPYAWALGANGEAGVRKVLDLLREELLNAMIATGCAKISDIRPTLLRR